MPKAFKNPLTQPSPSTSLTPYTQPEPTTITETHTSPATNTSTPTETLPVPYTYTSLQPAARKRGKERFEVTHSRITLWLHNDLRKRFEDLVEQLGVSKAAGLDEAIADWLKKYGW